MAITRFQTEAFTNLNAVNYTEDFETNLGSWVSSGVSGWIRQSGGTPSSDTGPSSAHQGTFYIFVETSTAGSNNSGDTDFLTYAFAGSTTGTLDFWYHQFGINQGTLSVEAFIDGSWDELWNSTGDQGDQWINKSLGFRNATQIRFKNVAAGDFRGDVALDLISIDAPSNGSFDEFLNVKPEQIGNSKVIAGYIGENKRIFDLRNFELGNISYSGNNLSVIAQDERPSGIRFNNDGTKMFVLFSFSTDAVHQYSLTTPYDITTATYDNISFSVAAQDSQPTSFAFSSDGLKMFMVGTNSDSVFQYSTTNPYDISNLSYDNKQGFFSAQSTVPKGLNFNKDGTKLFIIDNSNNNIFEYTLPSPFDLSGMSYSGNSFFVGDRDDATSDLTFNGLGTKMFILGRTQDVIYQYTLSTAYDITTATYDNVSSSVAAQSSAPEAILFANLGKKLFVVENVAERIFQYDNII